METTIATKEHALNALGVFDGIALSKLRQHLEFIRVDPDRKLVTKGAYLPTILVAVAGSVTVTTASGSVVEVAAPCVLDTWVADDRRIAQLSATATVETQLLLIDWSFRDSAFTAITRLAEISSQTKGALTTAAPSPGRALRVEAEASSPRA